DVALSAGIAVPVPGAAKVPGLLDDAKVSYPGLLQSSRREETAEAPADDHRVELFVQRGAGEGLDVGVQVVVGVLACDFLVLVVTVRAETLGALLGVLLAQFSRVEAQLCGSWNSGRCGLRYGFTHCISPPYSIRTPSLRSILISLSLWPTSPS